MSYGYDPIWAAKSRLRQLSESHRYSQDSPTRHKCFISYHSDDAVEVLKFVENFESVFIPKVIGISDEDPAVDSNNTDYIMDRIRDKYLADSTVTIVMVGECTWARKFIDWEVYSSLRRDRRNRLNGLMAIQLPGAGRLPDRVDDNVGEEFYGRYYKYPRSNESLRSMIDDAYNARQTRAHLIDNSRARRVRNSPCP